MRIAALLSSALFLGAAPSQATVNDVGLTMLISNTSQYGQMCGVVGCTPFTGQQVQRSQVLNLAHWGAPTSLFALAIALPGPCFQFPGIANSLMLDLGSMATLTVGVTGSPGIGASLCVQPSSRGPWSLPMPANAPVPITFRLQSLGISNSGTAAMTRALELTLN